MDNYLRLHKAQTEMRRSDNGEIALLATIDQQHYLRVRKAAWYRRVKYYTWGFLKGGATLRENIPLRTFQYLIRNDSPSELYCLYIVSEKDTIFYVGQALNPTRRLCERLNPYGNEPDEPFAKFLRMNVDEALSSWRVQLLTLQDCEPFVVESFLLPECNAETIRSEVIERYTTDTTWAMNQAEQALIWLYQPCHNYVHNPFPTQIPAKYSDSSTLLGVDRFEEAHIVAEQQIQ